MSQNQPREKDAFSPYLRGEYREAFPVLKELADEGDVDALLAVGWMQECGLGTERDISKAYENYKIAHEIGSLDATHRLGLLLVSEGKQEEAKSVLESGANRNSLSCMLQLGILLLNNPSSGADVDKGWSFIERSADLGNIFAKRKWWSFQWNSSNSIFARFHLLIDLIPLFWEGVREIIRDPHSEKVF